MKNYFQESIWTRQRKLQDEEAKILAAMRTTFKSLGVELDNDDWRAGAVSADLLISQCVRQAEIERELEGVTPLVEGFDRINERMEQLEQTLMNEGIGI